MLRLERRPYDAAWWGTVVADHPDAEVFHTPAWLDFLALSQHAEPVVAAVLDDGVVVGHFVGAIVRRFGVLDLGSPLRGWATECMGFLLQDGVDRRQAADALVAFAFGELRCLHVEFADRRLTAEQMVGSSFRTEISHSFSVDLTGSEDVILRRMSRTATRQRIGRAERDGVRAEQASDLAFAAEFHVFLTATFARQGLVPTYSEERVRQLITALLPSDHVLLLRVRAADGTLLAAGLSLGHGTTSVAWGMAMDRAHDDLNPAQVLWWESMRSWRARGATSFDMGGAGDYKLRYGSEPVSVAHFHRSRYAVLETGRSAARRLVATRQSVLGRRRRGSVASSPPTPE